MPLLVFLSDSIQCSKNYMKLIKMIFKVNETFFLLFKCENISFVMPDSIYLICIYAKLPTIYQVKWEGKLDGIIRSNFVFIYKVKYNYQYII